MAAAVLFYFSDDILAKVDAIVARRKAQHQGGGRSMRAAELRQANAFAKHSARKAQEYIKSLNLETRARKPSRVAVMSELLELGLRHYKDEAAKPRAEPQARKRREAQRAEV